MSATASKRSLRVGIDVGGTFTDAVAIDNSTGQILGRVKIPTTHEHPQGVAAGVVLALQKLLTTAKLSPENVVFISHGTTQATNALLEGDVTPVAIIGMGQGLEAGRAAGQTTTGDISLGNNKVIKTDHHFLNTTNGIDPDQLDQLMQYIKKDYGALVASEAYAVDDPGHEQEVLSRAADYRIPATASHEISKRYGLRVRTRTAAINASILPTMIKTADMTESSVRDSGITAPVMIMRGDGGAMSIAEMRRRPILTLLSGPAAGVAGALMHAKIANGIFLEVGGTSTDISLIKQGKVMVDYAFIGGHPTYLRSLDIRTIGVAGGSMVHCHDGRVVDVGPRSAHIAGLGYACYANIEEDIKARLVSPRSNDPGGYVVDSSQEEDYAVTLSCAANALELVPKGAYAYAPPDSARKALQALGDLLGQDWQSVAGRILTLAAAKARAAAVDLLEKYGMSRDEVVLIGGGGGAGALVPFLSENMGIPYQIAKDAEIISTVGVALALIRDTVERTIVNPTEADVLRIRREAERSLLDSGAHPSTIVVDIEIDSKMHLVRAIATGAFEMYSGAAQVDEQTIKKSAALAMRENLDRITLELKSGGFSLYGRSLRHRGLAGLLGATSQKLALVDDRGRTRVYLPDGCYEVSRAGNAGERIRELVDRLAVYGDSGRILPIVYLCYRGKVVDLSGTISTEQILSLVRAELEGVKQEEEVLLLGASRL